MLAVAMLAPGVELWAPALRPLGLGPLLGGVLLHRAGTRRFSDAGTTIEPTGDPQVLVQDGIFAWTRNPMYLSGALILLGSGVVLGMSTPFLVVPLYLTLASVWFIGPEEAVLEARFGDRYRTYRGSVRRWI